MNYFLHETKITLLQAKIMTTRETFFHASLPPWSSFPFQKYLCHFRLGAAGRLIPTASLPPSLSNRLNGPSFLLFLQHIQHQKKSQAYYTGGGRGRKAGRWEIFLGRGEGGGGSSNPSQIGWSRQQQRQRQRQQQQQRLSTHRIRALSSRHLLLLPSLSSPSRMQVQVHLDNHNVRTSCQYYIQSNSNIVELGIGSNGTQISFSAKSNVSNCVSPSLPSSSFPPATSSPPSILPPNPRKRRRRGQPGTEDGGVLENKR